MAEEVGKISYSVTIDVAALQAGTKTAEQAVKTSFNSMNSTMSNSASKQRKSLGDIVTQLGLLTAAMLAVRKAGNFLDDSISAANTYQSAMLGLESVSASFTGETSNATQAAKELASDGLMSVTDAANSLKNLLASGFSLPEAITLLKAFKDNAAFGHQAALTFGESVRGATEGIKNGNSILVDNIGLTKNLSTILEEAGYAQTDLMKATSDASIRQALYNGLLKETAPFLGDAAKLSETAAGADSRLATSMYYLEARAGQLANTLRKDMVNGLASLVGGNQDAILSIGAGTATFIGMAVVIPVAIKAIASLKAALVGLGIQGAIAQARIAGIIGIISAVAGLVAGNFVENLLQQTDDVAGSMTDEEAAAKQAAAGVNSVGDSSDDTAKKLKKLDDEINKLNRSFTEDLAGIVQDHENSVKQLTKDIKDETANYNDAIRERLKEFNTSQEDEQKSHEKKVKELQNQIDFLRKYNKASNKQQLSELQFALEKENAAYQKQNEDKKAQYDADVQAEKEAYDRKVLDKQTQLNEELAFLEKHRDDVNAVRDVMLLDEIEMLKRTRDENLASLQQQKADTVNSNKTAGAEAGKAFSDQYQSYLDNLVKNSASAGKDAGANFWNYFRDTGANISQGWTNIQKYGPFALFGGGSLWTWDSIEKQFNSTGKKASGGGGGGGGWASGGYTGSGGTNEVAGLVHRGEYVIPKHLVDQSTGLPKADALDTVGNYGLSTTYQISIPISGAIVSSPQDQRKLAEVIGKRLNEIMTQKGYTPTIQGV